MPTRREAMGVYHEWIPEALIICSTVNLSCRKVRDLIVLSP